MSDAIEALNDEDKQVIYRIVDMLLNNPLLADSLADKSHDSCLDILRQLFDTLSK